MKNDTWDQKYLRGAELRELKRLTKKVMDAAERADNEGRCPVKARYERNPFKGNCNHHYHFARGVVHHYPNGKYIE